MNVHVAETEPGRPVPACIRPVNLRLHIEGLPPGDYTLRIEGKDHAGNASTPIEIPIHVAAHWWQQRWAHVAAVLALLVLGYVAALARTRVLRAQREALEVRVAERTAELDAANARLLDLSYRDALTGLANRRRLLDTLERTPAGSLAAVVAKQSGTEPALASQAVAHSTICMLVTVPVMLLLTGQLFPL